MGAADDDDQTGIRSPRPHPTPAPPDTSVARGSLPTAAALAETLAGAPADVDVDPAGYHPPPADPDRYLLGAEIARGGMGRIVAAHDRALDRKVAIKQLLDRSPAMRARFEREARITAKLQHPGTISILEAGAWPSGDLFYVMDLVGGQSLDHAIEARPAAADRLVLLANVIAVVDTIAYAHNLRVIHRDLKPGNVLCGAFGETVVIDWGLAKDLDDPTASGGGGEPAAVSSGSVSSLGPQRTSDAAAATVAGAVIGTPAYMPPEQADGQPVDERADVYALGAMLYHVLAGVPPYTAKTGNAVLVELTAGPPVALDVRAPHAPADLVTIVEKAMARAPADRYPSAVELAADLKKFHDGQLVAAHRYTAGQLARRWLRRHRAAVVVAAIAVVALAVFAGLAFQRVLREQREAEAQRALAVARGADAEELMSFMLGDLRDKLKPLGKLDLLGAVAGKAVAYYAGPAGAADTTHRAQHARALENLADVQLARAEIPQARAGLTAAIAIWDQLVAREPLRADFAAGAANAQRALATVLVAQGEATAARGAYERALAGLATALAREPGQLAWREQQLYTHRELGDALVELGDGPGAAAQFRAGIALATRYAPPGDREWLRARAIHHSQLGGVLLMQGDPAAALVEHRADLAISEQLAAAHPDDATLQSDVAGGHSRIGDVLRQTGDLDGALAEFRTALGVAARLSRADPTNADNARDLSVSHDRIGNVLLARGDLPGALAAYRAGMEVKRALLARDPSNAVFQRNVGVGHNKLGSVLEARRDLPGALAEYRAAVAMLAPLVEKDPGNAGWQRDLAVARYLCAEILFAQRDYLGSLAYHEQAAATANQLAALDANNLVWQTDAVEAAMALGKVFAALRRLPEARAAYQRAIAATEKLAAHDPKNPQWPGQLTALRNQLAACCAN